MKQIPNEISIDQIRKILQETFLSSPLDPNRTYIINYIGNVEKEKDGLFTFKVFIEEFLGYVAGRSKTPIFSGRPIIISFPFNIYRLIYPGLLIFGNELLFGTRSSGVGIISKYVPAEAQHGKLRDFVKLPETEQFELMGNSNVICWDNKSNRKKKHIIIPKAELFRFYFCPSTRVGNVLIKPEAIDNSPMGNLLYDPSSLSAMDSEIKEITIRKGMLVRDVPTIARIAYSSVAKREASLIGKMFISDVPNRREPIYFECSFPFEEPIRIECFGVELELEHAFEGSKKQARSKFIFIQKIIACYSHFPFQKLRYRREGDLDSHEDKKKDPNKRFIYEMATEQEMEDGLEQRPVTFDYSPFFDKTLSFLNSTERNPRFRKIKAKETHSRFPNLTKDIKPNERRKGDSNKPPKKVETKKKFVKNATTNDDTSQDTSVPSLEQVSEDRATATILTSLQEFMSYLRAEFSKDEGCEFFGKGRLENLIITFREEPKTYQYSDKAKKFVTTENGAIRYAIVIPVNYAGKYFLIMELHPRKTGSRNAIRVVYKNRFIQMDDEDINIALEALAAGEGKAEGPYISFKIYHEKDNNDYLAPGLHKRRILSKLIAEWSI